MSPPSNDELMLALVAELEAERDLFVRAIGRIRDGLHIDDISDAIAPPKRSAIVQDSLDALRRLWAEHQEMTVALDAFNAALGKAASRASEGRLVQTFAGGQMLTPPAVAALHLGAEPATLCRHGKAGHCLECSDIPYGHAAKRQGFNFPADTRGPCLDGDGGEHRWGRVGRDAFKCLRCGTVRL